MKKKLDNFKELESQVQALFAATRPEKAPSHLKNRVLAVLRERHRNKRAFWKALSAVIAGATMAGLFGFWLGSQSLSYQKSLSGQALMVRVEPVGRQEIAYANVVLPEGVEFYSEQFPGIRELRTLRFNWKTEQRELPLVVRSLKPGKQMIRVQFFGPNDQKLAEKKVRIDFKDRS